MDRMAGEVVRDTDGVWHVARSAHGCRYCGRVEVKYAANGRAAWHHPGAVCCELAVRSQIAHRNEELRRLRVLEREARAVLDEARRVASEAVGRDARDAQRLVARVQRGYDAQLIAWRLLTDGDPDRDVVGLRREIAELEEMARALAAMGS